MELKPRFDSNTIKMTSPVQKVVTNNKIVKDPERLIPNGIYKVIKWEILMQIINAISFLLISIASIIMIVVYSVVLEKGWTAYIIPAFTLVCALYKATTSTMEHSRLKREVKKYREDLKLDLTSQPPFIVRIYRNTFIKQIRHNWITFFLIFNGGIITLLLYWLKDVSWWIFDFKQWIENAFHNPTLMTIIFSIFLIVIFILHILFTIKRKKRIIDIESFSGEIIIPANEIDDLKIKYNKAYRRLFIIYIIIVLIIPVLIKIALKIFRKK